MELSACCCIGSLHRLGGLVDQEPYSFGEACAYERQAALPTRPLDPALLQELPF